MQLTQEEGTIIAASPGGCRICKRGDRPRCWRNKAIVVLNPLQEELVRGWWRRTAEAADTPEISTAAKQQVQRRRFWPTTATWRQPVALMRALEHKGSAWGSARRRRLT